MRTDRRDFMRALAGAAAWFAGGSACAPEPGWTCEIHQQTRNTPLGPVGRNWWPAKRKRQIAKSYAGRKRVVLPAPEAFETRPLVDVIGKFRVAEGFSDKGLSRIQLSRLLHFTNGVTHPPLLRAAPSAGAQYAGEIYVVVERVTDLEPGVYYYHPPSHSLVPIRRGPLTEELRRALERPGLVENMPVAFLLTNVFGRYGWRYANRGYRYALIDTGHIGENLRLTSRSAGLVETAPLRFHDELLNDLLEIDGRREAVSAMHAVGHAGPAQLSPYVRTLRETKNSPERWGATEKYHANTRLVEVAKTTSNHDRVWTPGRRNTMAIPGLTDTVEDCILKRRSAHRFDRRSMPQGALEWILDAAVGHPALARAPHTELLVVAHRIAALTPGLYRYQPSAGRLVLMRKADLRQPLVDTCLGQGKAGACAAAFFMVGHLRAAIENQGERAYRDLLIEAGGIGQRIYLAAEAVGFAARNLAAFRDDALNRLLGLDGREEAVLHLTLAGAEATAGGFDTPLAEPSTEELS